MLTVILALVVLTTVGAVAFPTVYAAAFPWRSTKPGRAAMVLGVALAIVLVLTTLGSVVGVKFPLWVALAAYVVLCVGVWWQLLALVFTLLRHRGDPVEQRREQRAAGERADLLDKKG